MSITSAGIRCDVCGYYCLNEILMGDSIVQFKIRCNDRMLHADKKCEEALRNAGTGWTKLPDGPMKNAYIEVNKKFQESKKD